jgi:hypothetical protein
MGVKPAEFEMVSQMETEAASEDMAMVSPGSLGVSAVGVPEKREGQGEVLQGKALQYVGCVVERG